MIFWQCNVYGIVVEGQCKFVLAGELIVLLVFKIGVSVKFGVLLSDGVEVVVVFWEVFVFVLGQGSGIVSGFEQVIEVYLVYDVVMLVYLEVEVFVWAQGFRQFYVYYGLIDGIFQCLAVFIGYGFDIDVVFILFVLGFQSFEFVFVYYRFDGVGVEVLVVIFWGVLVFVQLELQVVQWLRGMVVIGDLFVVVEVLFFGVQGVVDFVVGLLLLVIGAGSVILGMVVIGWGDEGVQLFKFVVVVGVGILGVEVCEEFEKC